MTDRSTLDAFERRIATELERYVAPASDPRPAAEIASIAMRPRGLVARTRNASPRRRLFVLGLAAALLMPAAYIGAGGLRSTPVPSTRGRLEDVSIFVRRDDGLSVFVVRPDGTEALLRRIPDSILPWIGTLNQWGAVSETGWLALTSTPQWPMILIDLGDPNAEPWVINEANLGGIGPRWGPTGLVAAHVDWGTLVIADPGTRTTRTLSMGDHGLVGGGPSIVWAASGTEIIGSLAGETYETIPIDGGVPQAGVAQVFDPRGTYGPGLAQLRVCSSGSQCPGGDDGRVERVELDSSARTIWTQEGTDRALAASFGRLGGEYWLSVDHDAGRQISFVHVQDGRQDAVATVNRAADWQYVAPPVLSPDGSTAMVFIDTGAKPAAVLVPLNGASASFHRGHFAGFVGGAVAATFVSETEGAPSETMPAAGESYRLPSLDELIAAELQMNPGSRVLGKATHEGIGGDLRLQTTEVRRDSAGAGDVYLDCLGPSSVRVVSGPSSATSPCLVAGSYAFPIDGSDPVIVTARGDTFWRVVIYGR